MAEASSILQEYLIKLGYKVDLASSKKFDQAVGATGKKIFKLGTGVAAMATAVFAATSQFSYSMRKMYFASDLANSSVKNLKGMEYAGKQIGITGDSMASSIHGMAQAMRLNPGLQGLIESFGVKVTGRDTSDVMMDYVTALSKLPEFVGAQYAAQFGISPDDYHQMINNQDKLNQKLAESNRLYEQAGVDPEKAQEAILEYTGMLDKIGERFDILGQGILTKLVEPTKELVKITDGWLESLTKWVTEGGAEKFISKFTSEGSPKSWEATYKAAETISDWWNKGSPKTKEVAEKAKETVSEKIAPAAKKIETQSLNTAEEIMNFFINEGWTKPQAAGITARLGQESGYRAEAVSPNDQGKGIASKGIAQWSPARRKDFEEVFGIPFEKSKKWQQLQFINYELRTGKERKAGRELSKAKTPESAWEAFTRHFERPKDVSFKAEEQKAVARELASKDFTKRDKEDERKDIVYQIIEEIQKPETKTEHELPVPETRIPEPLQPMNQTRLGAEKTKQSSAQINQTTNINVSGSSADATARSVAREQVRVNGDMLRNLKGAVS